MVGFKVPCLEKNGARCSFSPVAVSKNEYYKLPKLMGLALCLMLYKSRNIMGFVGQDNGQYSKRQSRLLH